jgi:hypothetical protein
MGTIMYVVCLILLILYSEFYHRYLISDDWPAREIDAASMSWDKTRVISRDLIDYA